MKKHDILVKELDNIEKYITNKTAKEFAQEVAEKRVKKQYKKGKLTKYLEKIQKYTAELQALKIYDKTGQEKAIKTLNGAQQLASQIIAKRYQVYQLWAIDKIETARKTVTETGWLEAYTNARAKEVFMDYLMDIDRNLLTYDVGTCYDKVHYLVFTDQVPTKDQAHLQYKKATFDKIGKLEDF